MRQRVLVLGASGFIGKRVITALCGSDWATPIAASRHITANNNSTVATLRLDATDENALDQALSGVTAIVNCVTGDEHTIVNGARALFNAATRQSQLPRVVHLSSLAAYGSTVGRVDEASILRGDLGPYSAAKAKVETFAAAYENAVCLRPGIVYGPGSAWWSDRIARLLLAQRLGDLGKDGEGICNLVHVDDVVQAVLASLRLPQINDRAFNLANPSPITWNAYFKQYAIALGKTTKPVSRLRLSCELKLLAYPYKLGELVESKFPALNAHPAPAIRPWLIDLCKHNIIMDSTRATGALQLKWLPLATGLTGTAQWFQQGGRV